MKLFKCSVILLWVMLLSASLQAQKIVVNTEDFAPYNFEQNGKVVGISTDIVREALKRSGLANTQIKIRPWARGLSKAMNNPNTALFSVFKNPKREEKMVFVGKVSEANSYFYKLKSRKDINIKNLQDTKKYKIGVVRDWISHEMLKQKGIIDKVQPARSSETNIKKMYKGRIDLFEIYDSNFRYLCKKNPDLNYDDFEKVLFNPSLSGSMYFVLNKGTAPSIITKMKKAFTELHADGTYQKILDKWLANN